LNSTPSNLDPTTTDHVSAGTCWLHGILIEKKTKVMGWNSLFFFVFGVSRILYSRIIMGTVSYWALRFAWSRMKTFFCFFLGQRVHEFMGERIICDYLW